MTCVGSRNAMFRKKIRKQQQQPFPSPNSWTFLALWFQVMFTCAFSVPRTKREVFVPQAAAQCLSRGSGWISLCCALGWIGRLRSPTRVIESLGFESWFCLQQALQTWAGLLASLNLSFVIWIRGVLSSESEVIRPVLPISQAGGEDWLERKVKVG